MGAEFIWLKSAPILRIADALGHENIRFVGGCVRDSLVGLPINDIDACTPLLPEIVIDRLQAADINVIPTGLDHGTVTAVADGQHVEVTTLRRDVDSDGRHADVAFTYEWAVDAARRDFTINALYVDMQGDVFDPLGGQADLKAGRVRFIGDAATRIQEDSLRILRFFRFTLRFSQPETCPDNPSLQQIKIDADGLKACQALVKLMKPLSKERIRDEFFKILAHPNPQPILKIMGETGVIPYILPPDYWQVGADKVAFDGSEPVAVKFLTVVKQKAKRVKKAARLLRLPNKQRDEILNTLSALKVMQDNVTRAGLLECLYYYGRSATDNAMMLLPDADHTDPLHAMVFELEVPVFPLKGRDIIKAGLAEGPQVGKALEWLERYWLEHNCLPNKQELLELV